MAIEKVDEGRLVILVTGDREWRSPKQIRIIYRELAVFPKGSILVHGAARGVDSLAGEIGKELGFEIRAYPADWEQYGRAAGPIRNRLMLKEQKPDIVIAFHHRIDESKGTKDMIIVAGQSGVKTRLVMC